MLVHTAGSLGEAVVIRSLLESAGIRWPVAVGTNFFARDEPSGGRGVEVHASESHVVEARKLMEQCLRAGASESESGSESEDKKR